MTGCAEGGAWYQRDTGLVQEPFGERLIIGQFERPEHACDLRKEVKGPLGRPAAHSRQGIKVFNQPVVPLTKGLAHGHHAACATAQGRLCGHLGNGGRVRCALRLDLGHGGDQFRRTGRVADTPACHGVGLGYTIQNDRTFQQVGADVDDIAKRLTAPADVLVHVVGGDQRVRVAAQNLAKCRKFCGCVDSARGIGGTVQDHEFGLVSHGRVQRFGRHLVTLFECGRYHHREAVGDQDDVEIGHPVGGRDDNFVFGIKQGLREVIEALFPAHRHEHLRCGKIKPVLGGEFADDRVFEAWHAIDCGVFGKARMDRPNGGFLDEVRGVEVWLADPEVDDVVSLGLEGPGPRGHSQGGRRLDAADAARENQFKQVRTFSGHGTTLIVNRKPMQPKRVAEQLEIASVYAPAGDQPRAIEALVEGLQAGLAFQTLLGVTGSGKTFTIANVIARVQRPALVLAPNKTLAAQLYAEMRDFFPHNAVEYFVSYYDYYQPEAYVPASDTFIEKDAAINEHIEQMRLSATKALLERPDAIIVGTVSAIYGLGDPAAYHAMILHLKKAAIMDQRAILKRLAEMQYTRNDMELRRGTFRVRGDVIDIFPAESEQYAIRVGLFDEVIEDLAEFDPLTGEVVSSLSRATIYPKSHYVTPRTTVTAAVEQIREELRERLEVLRAADKLVEAQRLEERARFDMEMMAELGYCAGIENYSRYLSGRGPGEPPPTLMDYLPKNALLVVDESHVTMPQLGGMYRGDRSRKETLVEYGFRLPSALDNRPLKLEEFEALMPQTIFVSATPGPYEAARTPTVVEQVVRPTGLVDPAVEVRPVARQVDDLLDEVRLRAQRNERVLVTTLTKRMAEDLTEYLHEHGVRVRYLHSDIDTVERVEIIRDLRAGAFDVLIGINLLREGLDIPEVSLVAILDADKEGFLRSTRSLIQTIGRAARHLHGRAILYADRITDSMRAAIDETERRRARQTAFNTEHGIIPQGVVKAVKDLIDGVPGRAVAGSARAERDPAAEDLSPERLGKLLKKLEKDMYRHAQSLEFEQAARLRDRIAALRRSALAPGSAERLGSA